ncbi:MAG: glutamate--tRNA ligase [Parvularculales bacterium]
MTQPMVRFAPSPTGRLHVGNLRTALYNWLFARASGGQVLLRFDDTDPERCREEYVTAIRDDLRWLGLEADEEVRQSAQAETHKVALEVLAKKGLAYPCYETTGELERQRRRQLGHGKPPVYDRAALALSTADRARLEAEGRKPYWRFRLSGETVRWTDMVRGDMSVATDSVSDPVIQREDGRFLYTLPSVVDDGHFSITHIIRGEDHATNTAAQIELHEALGLDIPVFAHHPLLVGAKGTPLSKRHGTLTARDMENQGIEPMALAGYLAGPGLVDATSGLFSLEELATHFDLTRLGRTPTHFDEAVVWNLNTRLLHGMAYRQVRERLEVMGIGGGAMFWEGVRDNLERFDEVILWWQVVVGPVEPVVEDAAFLAVAVDLLPLPPWDESSWGTWTKAISEQTGTKGQALYKPLRLALTGKHHGPALKNLLPLISPEQVKARLAGLAA